jgi:hypothetical protein
MTLRRTRARSRRRHNVRRGGLSRGEDLCGARIGIRNDLRRAARSRWPICSSLIWRALVFCAHALAWSSSFRAASIAADARSTVSATWEAASSGLVNLGRARKDAIARFPRVDAALPSDSTGMTEGSEAPALTCLNGLIRRSGSSASVLEASGSPPGAGVSRRAGPRSSSTVSSGLSFPSQLSSYATSDQESRAFRRSRSRLNRGESARRVLIGPCYLRLRPSPGGTRRHHHSDPDSPSTLVRS